MRHLPTQIDMLMQAAQVPPSNEEDLQITTQDRWFKDLFK